MVGKAPLNVRVCTTLFSLVESIAYLILPQFAIYFKKIFISILCCVLWLVFIYVLTIVGSLGDCQSSG